MGVRVESPFPSWAWPRVWLWIQDFRSRVADDFAPQNVHDFVVYCLERARAQKSWGVWADDELCGLVTFEPSSPVVGTSHALFRKDFWGREITETALRQVYTEIFAGGANKICGCVFRDNNAILAMGATLGARREGVLRQQTRRGGKFVDMVAVGLLKEDFEKCLSSQT